MATLSEELNTLHKILAVKVIGMYDALANEKNQLKIKNDPNAIYILGKKYGVTKEEMDSVLSLVCRHSKNKQNVAVCTLIAEFKDNKEEAEQQGSIKNGRKTAIKEVYQKYTDEIDNVFNSIVETTGDKAKEEINTDAEAKLEELLEKKIYEIINNKFNTTPADINQKIYKEDENKDTEKMEQEEDTEKERGERENEIKKQIQEMKKKKQAEDTITIVKGENKKPKTEKSKMKKVIQFISIISLLFIFGLLAYKILYTKISSKKVQNHNNIKSINNIVLTKKDKKEPKKPIVSTPNLKLNKKNTTQQDNAIKVNIESVVGALEETKADKNENKSIEENKTKIPTNFTNTLPEKQEQNTTTSTSETSGTISYDKLKQKEEKIKQEEYTTPALKLENNTRITLDDLKRAVVRNKQLIINSKSYKINDVIDNSYKIINILGNKIIKVYDIKNNTNKRIIIGDNK